MIAMKADATSAKPPRIANVLAVVGWQLTGAVVAVGLVVRDHIDMCGEPADDPSSLAP